MQYWHRYRSPSGVWIPAYVAAESECPELRWSDTEYCRAVYIYRTPKRGPRIVVNESEPRRNWAALLVHERGHAACERIGVSDHGDAGSASHRIIDAIAEEVAPLVRLPPLPAKKREPK